MTVTTISNDRVAYDDKGVLRINNGPPTRQSSNQTRRNRPRRKTFKTRALQVEPRWDLLKPGRPVAADCEGVILDTKSGMEKNGCGRTSFVDFETGAVIYDAFAYYPREEKARPPPAGRKLGVYWKDIKPENGARPIKEILRNVEQIMDISGTLVAHSASHETTMLRGVPWHKYEIRDTQRAAEYQQYAKHLREGPSLSDLTYYVLGRSIQQTDHDSVEDAVATGQLYVLHKDSIDRQQGRSVFYNQNSNTASLGASNSLDSSTSGSTIDTPSSGGDSAAPTLVSNSAMTSLSTTITTAPSSTNTALTAPPIRVAIPDLPRERKGRVFDRRTSRYI